MPFVNSSNNNQNDKEKGSGNLQNRDNLSQISGLSFNSGGGGGGISQSSSRNNTLERRRYQPPEKALVLPEVIPSLHAMHTNLPNTIYLCSNILCISF